MATEAEPVEGLWYYDRGSELRFQVVGLDTDEGMVEIQHFSGDLDTIPLNRWPELDIEPAEPSLNPCGPTDDTSDGRFDSMADDPHAAHLPGEAEVYRREHVEWAGKATPGAPEPRPEHGPEDRFERGSERGVEQWPETRDSPGSRGSE